MYLQNLYENYDGKLHKLSGVLSKFGKLLEKF